jgi:hypothetical protein
MYRFVPEDLTGTRRRPVVEIVGDIDRMAERGHVMRKVGALATEGHDLQSQGGRALMPAGGLLENADLWCAAGKAFEQGLEVVAGSLRVDPMHRGSAGRLLPDGRRRSREMPRRRNAGNVSRCWRRGRSFVVAFCRASGMHSWRCWRGLMEIRVIISEG